MDTQLFQSLALVLLVVIAILLGTVAALLARVRRAVERVKWSAEAAPQAAAVPATESQPEPLAAAAAPATESATVRTLEPAPSGSTSDGHEREATEQPASVFEAEEAAASDEPQEQPFEREGRWWFRRGDELLVYDEQTGQWLPAPAPTVAASLAQSSEGATRSGAVATETRTMQGLSVDSQTSSEHSGGFWKCPSCGAVNGSTATSCRMCFSARPA
jgi:hypothetical protein